MCAENFYTSDAYADLHPSYDVEDSAWKAARILTIIARNRVDVARVVDVGCGAGEILRQLQIQLPHDSTFTGYDIAPRAIELANTRSNDRLHFVLGDFTETTDHASLLLCVDVIEHVEDYLGFLKRLVSRANYTIFHIPLEITLSTVLRVKPILAARENVGHLHYFTKETALAALEYSGFQIVDWQYTRIGITHSRHSLRRMIALPVRWVAASLHADLGIRLFGGASLLVLAKGRSL